MKDEKTHLTIMPKSPYKLRVLRQKNSFLDVSNKSNGLDNSMLEIILRGATWMHLIRR